MKLTTEQIEILKEGKIEDNRFYLQGQLDRKQYTSINEVLETIGLKWTRWKKAHIIEWFTQEELENAINDVIETWEVETLKETIKKFQFFPTPKEVAEYLVELAEIKENERVLEPSAWLWNIADEIKIWKLTTIELDFSKCEELLKKWYTPINSDFLSFNWNFDKIVANPPFSKSQDVKHILKAYELLNEWWKIVSVASSSIQHREGKLYDELRALNPEFIELPEWSFKESWTMVNSVIVVINK
jgi:type I restriction-modification system DNA methylase subunit